MADVADFEGRRNDPRRVVRTDSRVPPHNLDAEASLLGAMLLDEEPIGLAIERGLESEDFYKPAHGHVYAAIRALAAAAQAVDVVTVSEELRRSKQLDELGGLNFLVELQNSTPSVSSAGRYVQIVRDTAILRRLIKGAADIAEIGFSSPADVTVAIDQAEQIIFDIGEDQVADSLQKLENLTVKVANILEARYDAGSAITGLATGYKKLDQLLSGLQPGTLNIIGARPAMGKSAFALGMAVNAAKTTNRPVLFFSLEMSATELTQRVLSAEAQVDSDRLRSGQLQEADWQKIARAINRLDIPLYIDDMPQVTVMQIRQKIRRIAVSDRMPAMVVIDYLQLMGSSDAETRQLAVSDISRGLKLLAREFGIPVVALSQLSRGVEQRQDKRPLMSDLRESGALEQDADVIMFLHRDEATGTDVRPSDRGFADVIVAKHRSGPTDSFRLLFVKPYTMFADDAD